MISSFEILENEKRFRENTTKIFLRWFAVIFLYIINSWEFYTIHFLRLWINMCMLIIIFNLLRPNKTFLAILWYFHKQFSIFLVI